MVLKLIKKITKMIALEPIVRFSARITADVVFFGVTRVRDPRFIIGVTAAVKASDIVAQKYKRTKLDSQSIFEDSIDGVIDAF